MTVMVTVMEIVKGEIARLCVCVCGCYVQAKAQRSGIYSCCELLKKLHSVRCTDFTLCFCANKCNELHTV